MCGFEVFSEVKKSDIFFVFFFFGSIEFSAIGGTLREIIFEMCGFGFFAQVKNWTIFAFFRFSYSRSVPWVNLLAAKS